MAQVRVTPQSNMKWVALLAVLAAAGGLAWWTMSGTDDQSSVSSSASVDAASAVSGGASQSDEGSNITDVVPEATSPAVVVAQQQEAAQAVTQQSAELKPIQGPVSERPDFISPMEWSLLQAVSQQHPNPDQKLVNMLNFVRYGKQSEALEAMPKPGEPGKRRALAEALIQDLPQRLINGDLDLAGARTDLTRFLEDAEPDASRRQKRLESEMKRLTSAEDQYRKSESEKSGQAAPARP